MFKQRVCGVHCLVWHVHCTLYSMLYRRPFHVQSYMWSVTITDTLSRIYCQVWPLQTPCPDYTVSSDIYRHPVQSIWHTVHSVYRHPVECTWDVWHFQTPIYPAPTQYTVTLHCYIPYTWFLQQLGWRYSIAALTFTPNGNCNAIQYLPSFRGNGSTAILIFSFIPSKELKGAVPRDFLPLFFIINWTHLGPW